MPPPLAKTYWRSHELSRVTSIGSLMNRLRSILEIKDAKQRQWVFRGAEDEAWGLHSKLARSLQQKTGSWPTEHQMRQEEIRIIG